MFEVCQHKVNVMLLFPSGGNHFVCQSCYSLSGSIVVSAKCDPNSTVGHTQVSHTCVDIGSIKCVHCLCVENNALTMTTQ